jgi:hypothetical protein
MMNVTPSSPPQKSDFSKKTHQFFTLNRSHHAKLPHKKIRRGDDVKRLVGIVLVLLSGCGPVNRSLLLDKGAAIAVEVNHSDTRVAYGLSLESVSRELRIATVEVLKERGINAVYGLESGKPRLEYDLGAIRAVVTDPISVSGDTFKLIYSIKLTTPDGKVIFAEKDEKDDHKLAGVINSIADRTANLVVQSYKQ